MKMSGPFTKIALAADDYFSHYETTKMVKYESRTLSRMNMVLIMIILCFELIYRLGVQHQYMEMQAPIGIQNLWTDFVFNPPSNINRTYCNNSDYDWGTPPGESEVIGSFSIGNTSCEAQNGLHVVISNNEFAMVTAEMVWMDPTSPQPKSFFVVDPELTPTRLIHTVSVSGQPASVNPATTIYRRDGTTVVSQFPAGSIVQMTVGQWLSAAGLSLDDIAPQGGGVPPPYPHFRLTGCVILIRMRYSNVAPFYASKDPTCSITVEMLPYVWGLLESAQQIRDVGYGMEPYLVDRTGVRLRFVVEGEIGQYSSTALMFSVMEVVVLLNISRSIVDFVARHLLKQKTQFVLHKVQTVKAGEGGFQGQTNPNAPVIAAEDAHPQKVELVVIDSAMDKGKTS